MKTTLKQRVFEYLEEFGSMTVLECVQELGTTELRKIVSDLKKDGFDIEGDWTEGKNRFGEKVEWKRYSLAREETIEDEALAYSKSYIQGRFSRVNP